MKIYTKTGDKGETGLVGGKRIGKDAVLLHAYGTVDELNSILGIARAHKPNKEIDEILIKLQNDLFILGADLANPAQNSKSTQRTNDKHVDALEKLIDSLEAKLEPLKSFIMPGGGIVGAQLHAARCICRRAERHVVSTLQIGQSHPKTLLYLNRLSDLLFVMARSANKGQPETPWKPKHV